MSNVFVKVPGATTETVSAAGFAGYYAAFSADVDLSSLDVNGAPVDGTVLRPLVLAREIDALSPVWASAYGTQKSLGTVIVSITYGSGSGVIDVSLGGAVVQSLQTTAVLGTNRPVETVVLRGTSLRVLDRATRAGVAL